MTDLPEEVMSRVKVAVSAAIYKARYHAGVPSPDNVTLANLSVDAVLSALTAEGYMVVKGWRPIEEAPANGHVQVFGGRHLEVTVVPADGDWWRSEKGSPAIPTRFAPLLPAPESE